MGGTSCCCTTELVATCKNEVGALARASQALAQNNINIDCMVCYGEGTNAKFHFITTNNAKAKKLLADKGWTVTENEVCRWTTPNTAGTLNKATTALAEAKVDIQYCYTSCCPTANTQDVIFCTNNSTKANQILGASCCTTTAPGTTGHSHKGTGCCG